FPAAEKAFVEGLGLARADRDRGHEAKFLDELARLRSEQGRSEEAVRLQREVHTLYVTWGVGSPLDIAQNLTQLALTQQAIGGHTLGSTGRDDIVQAEAWLARASGEDPIRLAMARGEVAIAYRGAGELPKADALLVTAIAELRAVVPGDHAEL